MNQTNTEINQKKELLVSRKKYKKELEKQLNQIVNSKFYNFWQKFKSVKNYKIMSIPEKYKHNILYKSFNRIRLDYFKLKVITIKTKNIIKTNTFIIKAKYIFELIKNNPFKYVLKTFTYIKKNGIAETKFKIISLIQKNELSKKTDLSYFNWINKNEPSLKELKKQKIYIFKHAPKISIVTPVYNVDKKWLKKCINSVIKQTYQNWELILVDDCSTKLETISTLKSYIGKDKRVKIIFNKKNQGISNTSNVAIDNSNGEFIGLLDNDDELTPQALFEVVKVLNQHKDADFIYSDEDKIDIQNKRFDPFFKPDWSPYLLTSFMYTGHFSIYRKTIVDSLDKFRHEYDFSQDYDLALRISEKTREIYHIQKILYHWRTLPESGSAGGKPYARKTNIAALEDAVKRRHNESALVVEYPFANKINFFLDPKILVSIIIPSDNKDHIKDTVNDINKKTNYKNIEIIIVTNSKIIKSLSKVLGMVNFVKYDEKYSFSKKCNFGAKKANGEILIILNDDIRIVEKNWIEELCGIIKNDPTIGAVSPKLIYDNDTIQYAGMVTNVPGLIGTAFHQRPEKSYEYFNLIQSVREVSLLSGACFAIKKIIYEKIGGFDEINTPIMHSDVDLSFRLRKIGLSIIYNPFAKLIHFGHLSIKKIEKKYNKNYGEIYLIKKWGEFLEKDPYFTKPMAYFLYQPHFEEFSFFESKIKLIKNDKKNILIVSHDLSLSGAPILVYSLAKELISQGYFITVISPNDGELKDKYLELGIPVILDKELDNSNTDEFKRFLANFDLVIANTILNWRVIYSAKETNVPSIWYIHESKFGIDLIKKHIEIKKAFSICNKVIFPCNYTKNEYHNTLKKETNNLLTIHTGITVDGQMSTTKHSKNINIIDVGSIEERKGQDILIEALKKLPKQSKKNIKIFFIGRILDNTFYKLLLRKKDKNIKTIFTGQLTHKETLKKINNSDIFILSSRDEVLPLTILEAMGCGKAIIAPNITGIPELIKDDKNGLLFQKDNSNELAKKIIKLTNNEDKRIKLGNAAKNDFLKKFTIKPFSEKFIEEIDKL